MPVNYLLIENLRRFHQFYGDGLKIECPTGSGIMLTLDQIADELCRRLIKLFLRGADGRRPVFGGYEKFQTDPHFKDYILFHEYSTATTAAAAALRTRRAGPDWLPTLSASLRLRRQRLRRPCARPRRKPIESRFGLDRGASRSAAVPRSTCVGLERWNAGTGPAGCAAVPPR